MTYISHSIEDTHVLAEQLAYHLKNLEKETATVFLKGNLGTGKTALMKELALVLNIEQEITSPTYVISKEYSIELGHFKKLVHVDAYRLSEFDDFLKIGYGKRFGIAGDIICIEWPELVNEKDELKADIEILSEYGEGESDRIYTVKFNS